MNCRLASATGVELVICLTIRPREPIAVPVAAAFSSNPGGAYSHSTLPSFASIATVLPTLVVPKNTSCDAPLTFTPFR